MQRLLKKSPGIKLPAFLIKHWQITSPAFVFDTVFNLKGTVFRQQKGRKTFSVCIKSKTYFIKTHTGFCLKEAIKNYLSLKRPVLSALNELKALDFLKAYPWVPRVLGYGFERKKGLGRSFIITQNIAYTCTLEELGKTWPAQPPSVGQKRMLMRAIATIAQVLHVNNLYHRDFYLCHFLWHARHHRLFVIDWHRALLLKKPSQRLQIKDLAALYFSSLGTGLTERDFYYFIKQYDSAFNFKAKNRVKFWRRVWRRGKRLYQKISRKYPHTFSLPFYIYFEKSLAADHFLKIENIVAQSTEKYFIAQGLWKNQSVYAYCFTRFYKAQTMLKKVCAGQLPVFEGYSQHKALYIVLYDVLYNQGHNP